MRLQILELPSVVIGDEVQTPFVVVLDERESAFPAESARLIQEATGARGVLHFAGSVEIVH